MRHAQVCISLFVSSLVAICGCQKQTEKDTSKGQEASEQKVSAAEGQTNNKSIRPLATASGRFVSLEQCRELAAKQTWGAGLHEIPSTVIDKGVLRHIPYTSMRSGDFEVNVYGDPDDPCGVEIGIHDKSLKNKDAKRACIEYIQLVLGRQLDRPVIRSLNLGQDITKRNGLTYEVTPETEPDAYGGWWVSIYDEEWMDKSRANAEELKRITILKAEILEQERVLAQARSKKASQESKTEQKEKEAEEEKKTAEEPSWTAKDLGYSRTITSSSSSSGSVYVKGYTRKDGTYVRPHTRSRPRR